jgi:hypothetical protein
MPSNRETTVAKRNSYRIAQCSSSRRRNEKCASEGGAICFEELTSDLPPLPLLLDDPQGQEGAVREPDDI